MIKRSVRFLCFLFGEHPAAIAFSELYENKQYSIKLFVILKHASNRLFVSRVILISPSFPPGFPPPCPIRVQSSHHAGLTTHPYKSF